MKQATDDGRARIDREIAVDEKRRMVIRESAGVGGQRTLKEHERALTLVEKLHYAGIIGRSEYSAAGNLRNLYFLLVPPSEGVGSYGGASDRADPTRKADRKARRLTGLEILINGEIVRGPSRQNRATVWRFRDAMLAMCGVCNEEGKRVVDRQTADFMLKACTDSEFIPTQSEFGRARAPYIKDEGKKPSPTVMAIGGFFVRENLIRLAMYFQDIKGEAIR